MVRLIALFQLVLNGTEMHVPWYFTKIIWDYHGTMSTKKKKNENKRDRQIDRQIGGQIDRWIDEQIA